jgi:dual specificity tyrosine-phosphorylation-regulated kinase 2/3/4
LTAFEQGEILDYREIYCLGLKGEKIKGMPNNELNYGYDDDRGDYNVIMHDHIGYRFEPLEFLGKGSFG